MRALLLGASLLSLTLCPLAAAGPPGPNGYAYHGGRHTSGPRLPGNAEPGDPAPYGYALELFRLYVGSLASEEAGGEFERGDVERAAARLLPSVGLRQDLTISFSGGISAATGLSLSLPLTDREAVVRHELALQRVLISQQEEKQIRHRTVGEFVRSLRLVIHFTELAEVLARYEGDLARYEEAGGAKASHEGWGGADELTTPATPEGSLAAGLAREQGEGYRLELAAARHELKRALAHARAQQELLAGSLALQLREANIDRLDAQAILTAEPGPLPLPPHPAGRVDCGPQTDDVHLAALLDGEQLLQADARLARAHPRATLNITGSAGLEDDPMGSDWRAGLTVSVELSLPEEWPVDAGANLTANGSSFTASGTLRWQGAGGSHSGPVAPQAAHGTSLTELARERAELLSAGAVRDYEVAKMGVDLAQIRLEQAYARQEGQAPGLMALHELAQASVGQLAAQLELDLALLELAASCKSDWWTEQEWWTGQE